ncbi:phosphate/phosphite/phosphonate ABC transporter substrate-binding protein [Desertifilum sp. FACHB-1129]|uniref:Phosphonate ABC transporter substrate-binding protein n=2 Tax=Desertifilum tharense IPPAS B-1220 TaxID=1781255 RepID=A0A1E5QGX9_9CYAN|nr:MULTISPECIES: phosphate/phosphite/phosphonate ABC transporter substrate-binding protein [Desertifilum]MDA0209641.1 phosphate/phosphite/phosphonate ABC transporter substrate-binding protein [Cyanobacteria bacterium FC1]MBD2313051.1 phosphate/phosphite/phosphonate ABC transporter substrate-binding protein [Desertifilum sp. FACHB-1129]MBD2320903.1 phosphate/phosphite/phosphonate ABC transporter substrate-binding protein [Desertifilum sp. FACHB-866]MBD2331032.1 phosphate/phosphite/phosphonate AB
MQLLTKPISCAFIALLLTCACTSPVENVEKSPTSVASLAQSEPENITLNIAVIPSHRSQERDRNFQQLADYLQQELKVPINIQLTPDYESAVSLIAEEKVEVAYLGPFAYVKAKNQNPKLEPLVAHIDKETGRPWYTSVIAVDTQSGVQSLEDLKGKRFGFVSRTSTSGYLVPMAQFREMNIDPDTDFAAVEYAGRHDSNATALAEGKVDAAAMTKVTYVTAQTSGFLPSDRYKVIWESAPIPNSPVVINNKIPESLKSNLRRALVDAPEDIVGIAGSSRSSGYTLVQDEDYEPIRKMQALGLEAD